MVLKMAAEGLKGALRIVPVLTLVPYQIATEAVKQLRAQDPESVFMIQEVGTA